MQGQVSFSDLGVERRLVHALQEQGITEPFEVQREAIPDGMLGRDVCCRAPTGSGKTLAFGLPMISSCERAEPHMPTALILTPTRELAEQICSVLSPLAWSVDREVMAIYGGTSYSKQRRALQRGVDIVVACPGRLLDLMSNGTVELDHVTTVAIDEADRMADMGFMEPVCEILDHCAFERQTILFSATLDDEVADLVDKYLVEPVTIEVGPKEVSMDSMQHFFWMVRGGRKTEMAGDAVFRSGRSIIFCRTRAGVDRIGYDMEDYGLSVATLHGGLSQRERDRAMRRFSEGDCIALIATDVAARGIDIENVACVIHYDPPENGKAYKHRSGRTARAGAQGVVISLIQNSQKRSSIRVQKEVGIRCEFTPPNLEEIPKNEIDHFPAPDRSRRSNRSSRDNRRGNSHGGRRSGGRNSGGRRNGGGRNGGGRRSGSQRGQSNGYRGKSHRNKNRSSAKSGKGYGGRSEGGNSDGGHSNSGRNDGGRNHRGHNGNERSGDHRSGNRRNNDRSNNRSGDGGYRKGGGKGRSSRRGDQGGNQGGNRRNQRRGRGSYSKGSSKKNFSSQ